MRPGAVLINVGRAANIVEPDLLRALRNRTLRGAYLDLVEDMAAPPTHPMFQLANLVFSGYGSSESRYASEELLLDLGSGEQPREVRPPPALAWPRRARRRVLKGHSSGQLAEQQRGQGPAVVPLPRRRDDAPPGRAGGSRASALAPVASSHTVTYATPPRLLLLEVPWPSRPSSLTLRRNGLTTSISAANAPRDDVHLGLSGTVTGWSEKLAGRGLAETIAARRWVLGGSFSRPCPTFAAPPSPPWGRQPPARTRTA